MKKRTVVLCVISLILAVALSVTASGGLEDNCTISINIMNEQRNIVTVSGIVGIDTLVSVRIYNPGFSGSDVDLTAAQADTSAIQFFGTAHSQNGEFSLNVPMNTRDGGEFIVEVTVDETRYSDTFTFYPYSKQMWCVSTVKNATNATALADSVPEIMEIYGFADHELYQATTAQAVAEAIVASNLDAYLVTRPDLDAFLSKVLVLTAYQAKKDELLFTDGKMNYADMLGIDAEDWYLDYSNSTPILSADGFAGVKSDLLSGTYTSIEDLREKFVESMCYHAIMNSANGGSNHVAGLLSKYSADYSKAGFNLDLLESAGGNEGLFAQLVESDATNLTELAEVFNSLFSAVADLDLIFSTSPATLNVLDDGTVLINARVIADYSDAKISINGTQVATITQQQGVENYSIEAVLPEGTVFGDVTMTLSATKNGQQEVVTKTVTLNKGFGSPDQEFPFSDDSAEKYGFTGITNATYITSVADSGANGGFALQFGDANVQATMKNQAGGFVGRYDSGVYETYMELYPEAGKEITIRERLTCLKDGSTKGITLSGKADLFYIIKPSTVGSSAIIDRSKVVNGEWNQLSIRLDLDHGVWQCYLNGKQVDEGEITDFDTPEETYFDALQFIFRNIKVRNLRINEILGAVPTVTSASAVYDDGSAMDATNSAASSVQMDKLVFAANGNIVLGENDAKIIDGNGVIVPATVTANGTSITADYTGTENLPTGTYKLVIGKNATYQGAKLGAMVVKEFMLNAETGSADAMLTDTVNLSVYIENADSVQFYIDDILVQEFAEPADDGVYTYEYTPDSNGPKQFDIYVYRGNTVSMLSRAFTVARDGRYGEKKSGSTTASIFSDNKYYATGRVCIEGDFTPFTNTDNYYFEVGAHTNSQTNSTAEGYITLSDMIGYSTSDTAHLFTADGKLYDTEYTYEANKTMHIMLVLDLDADQYEFYVDGKLIKVKPAGTKATSLSAATNFLRKFTLLMRDKDGNKVSTPTAKVENFKVYQAVVLPRITGVAYSGNDALLDNGYVVPETATAVTLTLDRAYADVTEEHVLVTLDGEEVDADVVYDADAKTITLTGLNLTAGDWLEITMNENTPVTVTALPTSGTVLTTANVPSGQKLSVLICVGDTEGLAVLPVRMATVGNHSFASYKYLNQGSAVDAKLILANYLDLGAGLSSLKEAVAKTVQIEAAKVGMVEASMEEPVHKAFLWDINKLKPLVDVTE